jgi:hypothetical protein
MRWLIIMQFEKLSNLAMDFSINDILSGDPEFFIPIIYLIVSIAIYSIMIWHFYRFIARRDCFKIESKDHPLIMSILKYFLFYPIIGFLFFTGFSTMILFLTRDYSIPVVLSTSFGIIIAIRLTAYYNEDLSKDVSKMLPFALLGLVLVNPSYFSIEDIIVKLYQLPSFYAQVIQYILLIVIVEWILRSVLAVKNRLFIKKQSSSHGRKISLPS